MLFRCHTAQGAFSSNFWRNLGERRRVCWSLGLLNYFCASNAMLKSTCWIVNYRTPNTEICRLLWKPNTLYRLNETLSVFSGDQQDKVREQDTSDRSSLSPEFSFTAGCISVVGDIVFCTVGYVTRVGIQTAGQNAVWFNLSRHDDILNAWGKSLKVLIRLIGVRQRFE
jgi:hypothetical protein